MQSRDKAVAATKRLRDAVADQLLVEREARNARNAANKSYQDQVKEVGKLTTAADRQKTAYVELKGSLAAFTTEQERSSTERQRANIDKLNKSLERLKSQYESASTKAGATQGRIDGASGPDPKEVARFEALKKKINETEQEILEQTRALDKLNREYVDAGVAASDLARKQSDLEDVTTRLAGQQERLDREAGQAADSINRAGNEAGQTANQFRLWGDNSRTTLSFLQRIRGELLSIAAAYAGVYAIGGAVRSIYDAAVITDKAAARLTARLGDDQKQIGEEMGFVRAQADKLGFSYLGLLDQYTRFISAVPAGTLTLDQMKFTFQSVSEAARVAGLTMADMQSVFVALSQLGGKGINLEDLRQQLQDKIPGATEALRIGLSELEGQYVSLEDLQERISNSALSGTAIVALGLGLKRQFEDGIPQAVDTAQAALGRFETALGDVKLSVADSGFIDNLIIGLKHVNQQLATDEFKTGIQQFAGFLNGLIKLSVVLVNNIDPIASALKAVIAVKIVGFLGSLSVSILAVNAASVGFVAQMLLARSAVVRLKLVVMALYRALLLLPAAFLAGFAIGDYLQKTLQSSENSALVWLKCM